MTVLNEYECLDHKSQTPFGGLIAHHVGPCPKRGHGPSFNQATRIEGLSASHYFKQSGITACAQNSGGLCSFWMDGVLAVYQSDNRPLLSDEHLAPSIDSNRILFGDFLGTLPVNNENRKRKRIIVEKILGSHKFVGAIEEAIAKYSFEYLNVNLDRELDIEIFMLRLTSHVDSFLPGVLDLNIKPLDYYLQSDTYGPTILEFFDKASAVISNGDLSALRDCGLLASFVRDLLLANQESIKRAPASNLIRQYFVLWGMNFESSVIARLSNEKALEIGTIIIAVYDTTALSLLWAVNYIESLPEVKNKVVFEAQTSHYASTNSFIELVVLEALRLGGSNPTALWRRTILPFDIQHDGCPVNIPVGTHWWLDRWQANRDEKNFPYPDEFNVDNVRSLTQHGHQARTHCLSSLSRSRYEINSFSMLNTFRNPRKCPGRLFSVRMQVVIIHLLYKSFSVRSHSIDLALKKFSVMPRPKCPGFMFLTSI